MIRALIVDDERRARAYLAKLVAGHADVEIVGEARDGRRALEAIRDLRPDLVFLDVQMPEMNGLEVAKALPPDDPPIVVFTTAYDQFALAAFDLSATDYLLKPYDGDRLSRALDRVREARRGTREGVRDETAERLARLLDALESKAANPAAAPILTRVPVQAKGRIVLLDAERISHFASEDRLVFAHTRDEKCLVNFTIKDLELRLPPGVFFRVHRSYLVNLGHVREVAPWFHGKLMLTLEGGAEVPVSEDRAPGLRSTIGLASDDRK
ncbi:MAG: LytTR family transcriptional regulator DNA-binding domain-containing protein [Acidobacteria bacterium]|nr:LytTR family transcriptional regulator DNA-binding domain-containing protein [Acidobacteriota bacterium]